MGSPYHTKNGRTSKWGAFVNGVWHCDCEPRLPAEKFQTKNGGKNHGRWFYTCQRPQHKRCHFFLWTDDAKVREEAAVLNNSRSEPPQPPQTPRKPTSSTQPPTPDSRPMTAPKPRTDNIDSGKEESDDWSSSDDEAALAAAGQEFSAEKPVDGPVKAARTTLLSSPGKRRYSEIMGPGSLAHVTKPPRVDFSTDSVLATPPTSTKSRGIGMLSPTNMSALRPSPQNRRFLSQAEPEPSSLAAQALAILKPAHLDPKLEEELIELLNTQELRTHGITKGRDITRLAVQAREKTIAELQVRIAGLEAERETSRAIISQLKQDIAHSPPQGGGRRWQTTKPEV